jgi:hypothetical protein
MRQYLLYLSLLFLTACTQHPVTKTAIKDTTAILPNIETHDKDSLIELSFSDSAELQAVANNFYRNRSGHLYNKTVANHEIDEEDTLVDIPYFNGMIPQDLDPYSFEPIGDSWYAKDKKHIYLYRPTSGGMLIRKVDSVDYASFKPLESAYGSIAKDKQHLIYEGNIVGRLNSKGLKVVWQNGNVADIVKDGKSILK